MHFAININLWLSSLNSTVEAQDELRQNKGP